MKIFRNKIESEFGEIRIDAVFYAYFFFTLELLQLVSLNFTYSIQMDRIAATKIQFRPFISYHFPGIMC